MPETIIDSPTFLNFLGELEEKMQKGIDEHGKSDGALVDDARELVDEALDFCGWGFLAWMKAKRLHGLAEELEKKIIKLSK
jgi:hypothetical protein